jgi:hypothetical protein
MDGSRHGEEAGRVEKDGRPPTIWVRLGWRAERVGAPDLSSVLAHLCELLLEN